VSASTQPTLASADTVDNKISCEGTAPQKQAHKEQYTERIRSNFPNGKEVIGKQRDVEKTRRTLDKIYGTAAREGS
jgi:hypothetical protein